MALSAALRAMEYLPASVSALDRKSLQVQSSLASLLTYLSTGRLPISRRKRRVICGVARACISPVFSFENCFDFFSISLTGNLRRCSRLHLTHCLSSYTVALCPASTRITVEGTVTDSHRVPELSDYSYRHRLVIEKQSFRSILRPKSRHEDTQFLQIQRLRNEGAAENPKQTLSRTQQTNISQRIIPDIP